MPQITVIKGNKNWFSESFIEPDEIEIEETPSKHVIIEYKYPTEGEFNQRTVQVLLDKGTALSISKLIVALIDD